MKTAISICFGFFFALCLRADVWLIHAQVLTVDPSTNYAVLPNGVVLTLPGGVPVPWDTNSVTALVSNKVFTASNSLQTAIADSNSVTVATFSPTNTATA